MKTNIKKYLFLLLILSLPISLLAKDKPKSGYQIYKGAWFDVQYPQGFTVKPSLSSSSGQGFDSAYFISKDKKVKFYIFSPQWSGDATDIAINPSKEIEKDVKSDTKKGTTTKWFTYEAKDGTWTRSYQEISNEENNTNYIIGIEYANQNSYKNYKKNYLHFKKSLRQYAD